MAKGDLVFCDIETTGLDYKHNDVIEIAYMTQDMLEPVVIIPYDYDPNRISRFWLGANPVAMKINQFYQRYPNGIRYSGDSAISGMINVMKGSTLVGANIRFDARFIERLISFEPWHHRLFDLQAYASGVFGWDAPRGWNDICDAIKAIADVDWAEDAPFNLYPKFEVMPDHSAAADTLSVKNAYNWLKSYSKVAQDLRANYAAYTLNTEWDDA